MLVCIKPLSIKPDYLIDIRHKRFLKLHGTLEISRENYIITGEEAKFSLKNLLEEFGPLEEKLVRSITPRFWSNDSSYIASPLYEKVVINRYPQSLVAVGSRAYNLDFTKTLAVELNLTAP